MDETAAMRSLGGQTDPEQQQQQAKRQKEAAEQAEDMKNGMLGSVLSQEARARLNTIRLAKPEKGAQLEGMLLNMVRSGQLRQRLSEAELVGLLERVSDGMPSKATGRVKFDRRRAALDSDEEDTY